MKLQFYNSYKGILISDKLCFKKKIESLSTFFLSNAQTPNTYASLGHIDSRTFL